MSTRNGYRAGVPCWVAAVLPDAAAGVAFYTGLFGWEAADIMPPDGPGRYFVCTLGGSVLADPLGASFTISRPPRGQRSALSARPGVPLAALGLGRLHLALPFPGLLALGDLLLGRPLDPSDRPLLLLPSGMGLLLAHR